MDYPFLTEKKEGKASLRNVDEFQVDPNVFRKLCIGQAVVKYSDPNGSLKTDIINFGLYTTENSSYPSLLNSIHPDSTKPLALKEARTNKLISTNIKPPKIESKKSENLVENIHYLNISFEQKEEAKKHGATWNPEKKSWIFKGVLPQELTPFKKQTQSISS